MSGKTPWGNLYEVDGLCCRRMLPMRRMLTTRWRCDEDDDNHLVVSIRDEDRVDVRLICNRSLGLSDLLRRVDDNDDEEKSMIGTLM